MNVIHIQLFGILPATLILWIASRIRVSTPEDQGLTRWSRFLLGTLVTLLAILVVTMPAHNRVASFLWIMFMPVTCGVMAILLIQFLSNHAVWSGDRLKTLLLCLIAISLTIFLGSVEGFYTPLFIALSGLFVALVWWMWNRIGKKYMLVGAIQIILLGVSIWAADANDQLIESPEWLSTVVQILIVFIPVMSIGVAARLVFDVVSGNLSTDKHKILFGMILIVSTLFIIGYQMVLASVWDVATDGLGGPFLWTLVTISSMTAAMIMAWLLPGTRKLIALAFAVLVPLSMQYPHWIGTYGPDGEWGMSPAYITERRAETITNAIEGYYKDHDEYPISLKVLFPQNLIHIPRPIMIPGQTWCYEGGPDYYRLGYVYRRCFSTPASVRIHASSGEPPNSYWPCEDEAARYPGPSGYSGP